MRTRKPESLGPFPCLQASSPCNSPRNFPFRVKASIQWEEQGLINSNRREDTHDMDSTRSPWSNSPGQLTPPSLSSPPKPGWKYEATKHSQLLILMTNKKLMPTKDLFTAVCFHFPGEVPLPSAFAYGSCESTPSGGPDFPLQGATHSLPFFFQAETGVIRTISETQNSHFPPARTLFFLSSCSFPSLPATALLSTSVPSWSLDLTGHQTPSHPLLEIRKLHRRDADSSNFFKLALC